MTVDLHKKIIKKKRKKSSQKWSLQNKKVYFKNKRQIVLLFYPSCLNQGRKDGSALMFYWESLG